MKRFFYFLFILAATACARDAAGIQPPDEATEERISVSFSGLPRGNAGQAACKGSVYANEDSIANLNVWCYLDGRLDAFSYNEEGGCSVRLYEGKEYSIYAIANTGRLEPPYFESDALDYEYGFPDSATGQLRKTLPMSTTSPLVVNTGAVSGIVPLELSRMVARYNLGIGKSEGSLSRLEVEEVRVGNSPLSCHTFRENSPTDNLGGGDAVTVDDSSTGICLYLVENVQSDVLDENVCSFMEVRGRLVWEDRPTDASVYILDQDMTFRWYLKDSESGIFGIRRNTEYSGTLSWSDFGWISDPDHVTVDRINEDETHCITFCDSEGIPVSGAVFDDLDETSAIDLFYRVYPAADSSSVSISTNVPPRSIHLSFAGAPVHVRNGIFRQIITNDINREMPAEMVVTLTNASKGISCSAKLQFNGSGDCAQEWDEEDEDEIVNY